MTTPRIRALALCVFHHEGKILVHRFYDPIKQQSVFRPVGGGIEFGETSAQAIAREVQEELVQSIHSVRLLGTAIQGTRSCRYTMRGLRIRACINGHTSMARKLMALPLPWLGMTVQASPISRLWFPMGCTRC